MSETPTLPPTQYLMMEVLAARLRLGEPHWGFPQAMRSAVSGLVDLGYVDVVKDSDPAGAIRVALTDEGRSVWLSDSYGGREHPQAAERKPFTVGFFVTVEVDSFNRSEAGSVAEAALGWPGSWTPPAEPVESTGVLNGYRVSARIVRSQALMAHDTN